MCIGTDSYYATTSIYYSPNDLAYEETEMTFQIS